MLSVQTNSPEDTEKLGRLFGSFLSPGSFVALYGDLGGGKTCFTRGLVAALAPEDAHMVTSPTFSIMNEYLGKTAIYHFDFYRLHGSSDMYELGFNDYFSGDGICIAEWPERLEDLFPDESLSVRFSYVNEYSRILEFSASGSISINILQLFQSSVTM